MIQQDAHQDEVPDPSAGRNEGAQVRKRRRTLLVLSVILAVALVGGLGWYVRHVTVGRYMQSTNDAFVQSDAVIVSPKVGGYVERLFVADNQQVKAGQPLLRVDPRDYAAQTQQSRAQIGIAQASAQSVNAQMREQAAAVDQARAQLSSAQAAFDFAHAETARYIPLAESGAETKEKLAQLRNQEQQAGGQLAAARAALSAAQSRIGTLEAQEGQAVAQRRAAEAQLATADVNLRSTILYASIDGRIGNKSVQVGQFVQPGARLMSVVPMERLYVVANFKETQLALMRVGQPATISVDALDGVELHGRVDSFSPGTGAQFSLLPPQNATGNFTKIVQRVPVRILIEAGPHARQSLVPGMSAEVTVDTRSAKGERERIEQEQQKQARSR